MDPTKTVIPSLIGVFGVVCLFVIGVFYWRHIQVFVMGLTLSLTLSLSLTETLTLTPILGVYYGRPMDVAPPGMIGIEALVTFMGGQGNRRVN